jgi:hypothetical protein
MISARLLQQSENMSMKQKRNWLQSILFATTLLAVTFGMIRLRWYSQFALFLAASRGGPEDIRAALKHGCDVNGRGWGPTGPALILAASNGRADNVGTLLANGADVNAANQFGNTALIIAASRGHIEVVKTLLAAGAEATRKNLKGRDAIYFAKETHCDLLVPLLQRAAGRESHTK